MFCRGSPFLKCAGSIWVGIAKIAVDHPPPCQTGKRGKKVPQTILAIPYTPTPLLRAMSIWKQHISKGALVREGMKETGKF